MSKQTTQPEQDQLQNVQEALGRTEQVIEKYQKQMLIGVAVLVLVVSGYLASKHFYFAPLEKKAETAMFKGEFYFAKDSFQLALNGDNAGYLGFEEIINQYSGTKSGNLAKAYAGICSQSMGEYEKAIKYLQGFDADDKLVAPAIVGSIGDCYVELGKVKEAVSYFEKAATRADNNLVSPVFLKKAGVAYESLGDSKGALKVYNIIKEKYSMSQEASDIEKYIERASTK